MASRDCQSPGGAPWVPPPAFTDRDTEGCVEVFTGLTANSSIPWYLRGKNCGCSLLICAGIAQSVNSQLSLLVPSVLTRSFLLKYFHDVSVNGITTKHYEVPESVFTLNNTNNLCYCHNVSTTTHWPL